VVDHVAEVAVGDVVPGVAAGEVVFGKFQDDGDEGQEFLDGVRGDVFLKFFDGRAVGGDDGGLRAFEFAVELVGEG
jgi:hypothetical protein